MVFPFQKLASDEDAVVWRSAAHRAIAPGVFESYHVPLMVQEFQTGLRRCVLCLFVIEIFIFVFGSTPRPLTLLTTKSM